MILDLITRDNLLQVLRLASLQALLSPFVFGNRSNGVVNLLWKIMAFYSFEISQVVRMTTNLQCSNCHSSWMDWAARNLAIQPSKSILV